METKILIKFMAKMYALNQSRFHEKKNPQIIEEKIRNIKRTNSMDNANTF